MRKFELLFQVQAVAGPGAIRRRAPFPDPVQCQDRGAVEWTREERARGMALVMIEKEHRCAKRRTEALADRALHEQLFFFLPPPSPPANHLAPSRPPRGAQVM